MRIISLVFVLASLVLVSGCGADVVDDADPIRTVGPGTFASALESDAFVIQAHTPYTQEISGTDLVAERWQELASYDLPEDRDAPILVYCRSGRMSGIAAKELASLGYTNVVDLDGGMIAWERSGRGFITRS